jgi:hypothetical protein
MRNIENLIRKLVKEALKPSEFRDLMKVGRDLAMKRIGPIWSYLEKNATSKNRNGDRLYFEPDEGGVTEFLDKYGYEVVDPDEGIVKKKGDKNMLKMGKVLNRLQKDDEMATKYLKAFVENKSLNKKNTEDDYIMVISKSPYDIGGMTTDREWESCMNLRGGGNRKFVPIDIERGTIVAYFIRAEDKNIKAPVSRILIKPYINKDDDDDILYGIEHNHVKYGMKHVGLFKKLINLLDEAQKEKIGIFKRDEKLYPDSIKSLIVAGWDEINMYGINKIEHGLTIEELFKRANWLKDAKIKDAMLGWDYDWDRPIWYSGTWEEGIWGFGLWKDGTFEGEIWKDGFFESGTFAGGTWKRGNFNGGTFAGEIWEDGWFYGDTFASGVWKNGIFLGDTFDGETWEYGDFRGGTFKSKTWENGKFNGGTFAGETWKGGVFWRGTFAGKTWEDGDFRGGTFASGTWEDGHWRYGTWENGTWIKGNIWDKELKEYVESNVDPNEYFKNKKQ